MISDDILDMSGFEIRNVRFQILTADHSQTTAGTFWFNSTTNSPYYYNNSGTAVPFGGDLTLYVSKATFTTKGDIVAASGSSTPVRVPVGSNGQFLVADSTATPGVAYRVLAAGDIPTTLGGTTFTGTVTATNLSGTNTGDVTIDATGTSNGLSVSGQTLSMRLATSSLNGAMSNNSYAAAFLTYSAYSVFSTGSSTGLAAMRTLTAAYISDFDTQVRSSRIDQMAVPTSVVNHNNQRLSNLADATASGDAVNLGQLQSATLGSAWKNSVVAATTTAGTLSTSFANGSSIDGVTLATGNRILIKNQSTASENGIYTVNASGAPTRAIDADSAGELRGTILTVEQGTANGDKIFQLTTDNITLGTTGLTFIVLPGPQDIIAGDGLTKTGNTIDIVAGTGISVAADVLSVSTALQAVHSPVASGATGYLVVTASNTIASRVMAGTANRVVITNTAGTAGASTWDVGTDVVVITSSYSNPSWLTALAVAKITPTSTADRISQSKDFTIGDGTATYYDLTHPFNTLMPHCSCYRTSDNSQTFPTFKPTSTSVVRVTFGAAVASNTRKVVISA